MECFTIFYQLHKSIEKKNTRLPLLEESWNRLLQRRRKSPHKSPERVCRRGVWGWRFQRFKPETFGFSNTGRVFVDGKTKNWRKKCFEENFEGRTSTSSTRLFYLNDHQAQMLYENSLCKILLIIFFDAYINTQQNKSINLTSLSIPNFKKRYTSCFEIILHPVGPF